jgi:hypothetical protein
MKHTISYIIETDDNVRLQYVEMDYAPYYQPEWIHGINDFNSIDDVDPNEIGTPDIVRIFDGSIYRYYHKTLIVPFSTVNFRVSVLIDGFEGNNSFVYDGYNTFLKTRRVGSEIYTTVQKNKRNEERTAEIRISYSSDDSINTVLRILQEPCNIKLKIISCEANNGVETILYPVASDTFEYEFDTLTSKSDVQKQSLKFTMDVHGITNRFFVKSIREYVEIGEIDETYKYMDGKYYRRQQRYVDGDFVTYYAEATVIDNIGYQMKNYDKALHVDTPDNKTVIFTNYGRVFLENNAFYVITLANYDDINTTCQIKITYANNPTNYLSIF